MAEPGMGLVSLVTEAEYLSTVYEPDAEFVDGVIEERAMGEDEHSAWQVALVKYFSNRDVELNIRVRAELRNKVAERRFRVPDVALLDFDVPRASIAVHPPLTIFEILSPEDRYKRLLVRLNDFEGMGVQHIYVVDPENGRFSRYQAGQLAPVDLVFCRETSVGVGDIASLVR
jgi:Uma2 family endonuclease